jgi:thiaminase/transcriptional activator TenA
MKLSEVLFDQTAGLWEEAAEKPFVTEMALGTLDKERFRSYMLQDYLYLLDYIDILNSTMDYTEDPELRSFLQSVIKETQNESERVHLPNMRKIGIQDDDVSTCVKADVIVEYLDYMRKQLKEGLIAGLTALLQCSWIYAYIGRRAAEQYPEAIAVSPFKNWFEAYTCDEYIAGNQKWIDVLDKETAGISPLERDKLCGVFRMCAIYENRLWDWLYEESV